MCTNWIPWLIFTLVQMARILGGCAPALDYSQEAKKLWAKLGEKEEDVCLAGNLSIFPEPDLNKNIRH